MKYSVTEQSKDRIYVIEEDLISSNINKFEEELDKFIASDTRDILIDLTHVTKIDSMAIATLIRVKKKIATEGRNLHMTSPSEAVFRVLELSGLDSFLLG